LAQSHPDVKVIIVTTYSDNEVVDASIDAGARGFVVKDMERFTLKQSIRAVSRGEAVIDPSVAGRLLERVRAGANDEAHGGHSGRGRPDGRATLNKTQLHILRLISEGFSNREIAERVHLSENTVKSHVQEIFRKLEVRNRVEAALRAVQDGWV
jgi:DNA-binding NarL/FixJ family response regulator